MHKVFVYGTLRKGYGNHGLLASSQFVSTATVNATMYSMGYIPYVSLQGSENFVHGEVYEVDSDTLRRLDHLESYFEDNPDRSFYTRTLVETSVGSAFIYHIEYEENDERKRVLSGDWTKR